MFQDKALLVRRLLRVNRDDRDSPYPCGKVQHHGDIMVEQNSRQTIAPPEADLIMEEGCRSLDDRPEFRIGIGVMYGSIVVAIGQERSIDQRAIVHTGLEEIGERSPGEHG